MTDIERAIIATLKSTEDAVGHKLPPQDFNFVVSSLTAFCQTGIAKYINGAIEHGGSIFDRDLDNELSMEIVDLFFYSQAKRYGKKA